MMRNLLIGLTGALFLGSAAVAALGAGSEKLDGEAALAKRLHGLVAGQPISCVSARQLQGSDVIARTAIVYETTGSRVYVNRPRGDLRSLAGDRILVSHSASTQLCDADIVDLVNRSDGFADATVTLGEFIPYDKPRP